MVYVNCDGAIEPVNPGGHGVGGWVVKNYQGDVLHKGVVDLGRHPDMTNNIAEYAAVLGAVQDLLKHGHQHVPVVIRTDSMLVVRQLNDTWRCGVDRLRRLRDEIWILFEQFDEAPTVEWVPREQNADADDMSRSLY